MTDQPTRSSFDRAQGATSFDPEAALEAAIDAGRLGAIATAPGPSPTASSSVATDLFHRTMAFNYADAERGAIMRKVWTPTPWMVEVYTGRCGEVREHNIIHWCHDAFGPESSPIHGRTGDWIRGSATINGWTWFGFASEALMRQFTGAWPQPDSIGAAPVNTTEPRG